MDAPAEAPAVAALIGGTVEDRRAIVWRPALQVAVDKAAASAAADSGAPAAEARAQVLDLLRTALENGRAEVRRRFEAGAPGSSVVRANCYLADQIIRVVHDHVTGHLYPLGSPSTGELLSLVAVGGYGRGELAPQSDIDLLFLLPYKLTPRSEQVIEEILYFLWDLGFKVGHATRSVDDCMRQAKADLTICTSLLEARWLWGDQNLYRGFHERFQSDIARAARPASLRPSWPSAPPATSAWAARATAWNPTSRTARAACAISTRCTGSPSFCTGSTTLPSW